MMFEGKTKIALVGEVNAGKSSFIKYLTDNSEIKISPLPGETVKSKFYSYSLLFVDSSLYALVNMSNLV